MMETTAEEMVKAGPAGFSLPVPAQVETKESVILAFNQAVEGYYHHLDNAGKNMAVVVVCGATLLAKYQVTNTEFSAILKGSAAWLGSNEDAATAGHQVSVKHNVAVRGDDYTELGSHPYKQHGRKIRQLCFWQAGMNTDPKAVLNGVELAVKSWPVDFIVEGKPYRTPVDALASGRSLEKVHLVWSEIIRPQRIMFDKLTNGDSRPGRIKAAAREALRFNVTVRAWNETMNREAKVSTNIAKVKDTALIYGAVMGLLHLVYQDGEVQLDPKDKDFLMMYLNDGTIPTNIPLRVEEHDEERVEVAEE